MFMAHYNYRALPGGVYYKGVTTDINTGRTDTITTSS